MYIVHCIVSICFANQPDQVESYAVVVLFDHGNFLGKEVWPTLHNQQNVLVTRELGYYEDLPDFQPIKEMVRRHYLENVIQGRKTNRLCKKKKTEHEYPPVESQVVWLVFQKTLSR